MAAKPPSAWHHPAMPHALDAVLVARRHVDLGRLQSAMCREA
jgi:hypothetical protein